jgi:DMSO/TMAO reductase YedYZ heme-binding membrane subunit
MTLAASGTAFWYLSRGTGAVALLLLTVALVLGVVGVARFRSERLPRFLVQGIHRNLTLLAVAFVVVHVLTTVADGYAPIGIASLVVPFSSPYRPLWLGLGAVAFDLLLALVATSLLRLWIGRRLWRGVHWLAYVCWPIALVHALGTGTDAHHGWLQLLAAVCTGGVAAAAAWRLTGTREVAPWLRGSLAGVMLVALFGGFAWYRQGPDAKGWAARAGTPSALLAPTAAPTGTFTPTSAGVQGTISSSSTGSGLATIDISARAGAEVVQVSLTGVPLEEGGVEVQASRMSLGTASSPSLWSGSVRRLEGTSMSGVLTDTRGQHVTAELTLRIDQSQGTVSGVLRVGAIS